MILADTTSLVISVGIGVGAFIAIVFELIGVARNASGSDERQTITAYVRWFVTHSWVGRILVGVFVLSLFGHFMWGGMLLP